jgi:hypothetical protein
MSYRRDGGHPLGGTYRTLASGRRVWIDDRGIAHLVSTQGNVSRSLQDYEPEDPRIERAEYERDHGPGDEAIEWGGLDLP